MGFYNKTGSSARYFNGMLYSTSAFFRSRMATAAVKKPLHSNKPFPYGILQAAKGKGNNGRSRIFPALIVGTAAMAYLASVSNLESVDRADIFKNTRPVRPDVHRLDLMHEDSKRYTREECYQLAKAMAAYDFMHEDANVQWRFARAAHALATEPGTSAARTKELIDEALWAVTEAKAKNRNNGDLYRWAGTILQAAGSYQSTSNYIRNSFVVRDDWLAAVSLNPYDASAHHLLGRWAYEVARMSGWKRSIASTLFAEPPSASLDEALESFRKAEGISPGFWKANQLWLGMTEEAMGNKTEAARWASSALELPVVSSEDRESHDAALALLKRTDGAAATAWTARQAEKDRAAKAS